MEPSAPDSLNPRASGEIIGAIDRSYDLCNGVGAIADDRHAVTAILWQHHKVKILSRGKQGFCRKHRRKSPLRLAATTNFATASAPLPTKVSARSRSHCDNETIAARSQSYYNCGSTAR